MARPSSAFLFFALFILGGISFAHDAYVGMANSPERLTAQAAAPTQSAPQTSPSSSAQPAGTVEKQCQAGDVDVVEETAGDAAHPSVSVSSCFQSVATLPPTPTDHIAGDVTSSDQQTRISSTVCEKAAPNTCVVETCPPEALSGDGSQASGSCTEVASCAPGDTTCLNSSIQKASGASLSPLSEVSFVAPQASPSTIPTGSANGSDVLDNALSGSSNPPAVAPTSVPPAPQQTTFPQTITPAPCGGNCTATNPDLAEVQQTTPIIPQPSQGQLTMVAQAPEGSLSTFSYTSPSGTQVQIQANSPADAVATANATQSPSALGWVQGGFATISAAFQSAPTPTFSNGLTSINALAVRG